MRLRSWRERISTRSGAARWVESKVAALQEAVLPSIGEATFTSRELARRLGESLARRWNAGVYQVMHLPGWSVDFAPRVLDMDILRPQCPPPPRVVRPPMDLSLLQGFPEYVPPGPWTPEHILEFMPGGAPGLDGHRA
eukprot:4431972-Pyramimonas_sp.AAC.1